MCRKWRDSMSGRLRPAAKMAVIFAAGKAQCVCVTPRDRGSAADRWLKRHPDGVRRVGFRVRDINTTQGRAHREGRHILHRCHRDRATTKAAPTDYFDVATPLGDVRFRFVERAADALPPGFSAIESGPQVEFERPADHRPHHLQSAHSRAPYHLVAGRDGLRRVLAGAFSYCRHQRRLGRLRTLFEGHVGCGIGHQAGQ